MTGFQSKRAMAQARLEALQESPSRSVSDEVELATLEKAVDQLNDKWLYLRERVLEQIVKDVNSGDLTAIEELLVYCDEEAMRQFLPEEGFV